MWKLCLTLFNPFCDYLFDYLVNILSIPLCMLLWLLHDFLLLLLFLVFYYTFLYMYIYPFFYFYFILFFLPVACFHYDVALFRDLLYSNCLMLFPFGLPAMAAYDVGRFARSHSIPPFGLNPDILCFYVIALRISATPPEYYCF
jgi:hypothetical protein